MVNYGLTIENEKMIIDKAKLKRDGVYTFRGVAYRVRNRIVTHFAENKKILERVYGFNCVIGTYVGNSGLEVLRKIGGRNE